MPPNTLYPSILPDFGSGGDEDDEICGTEMENGNLCDRDPEKCPYH